MRTIDAKDQGGRRGRAPFGAGSDAVALTLTSVEEAILDPVLNASRLLRKGLPDEEVERLAGVTLFEVIGLRAAFATAAYAGAQTAPLRRRRPTSRTST